jgi:DNA-directed RNA polymerase specialized sigma24 family protein
MVNLTNLQIKKITKLAQSHACKRGRPELAEDFAQELLMKMISKDLPQIEKINISWRFHDFLRLIEGDVRTKAGRRRRDLIYIGDLVEILPDSQENISLTSSSKIKELAMKAEVLLSEKEKVVFHLLKHGYNRQVIATLMSTNKATIDQYMLLIKKKLK